MFALLALAILQLKPPSWKVQVARADGRGNVFAAWLDLRKSGTRLYGSGSVHRLP